MTQRIELVDTDIKVVIITVFIYSRKKRLNMLSGDQEETQMIQANPLEMKIIVSEMKNTLEEMNHRLNSAEEKMDEFEDRKRNNSK